MPDSSVSKVLVPPTVLVSPKSSLALHVPCELVSVPFRAWEAHLTRAMHRLAHWDGLQPYSDEDTSRGNLVSLS